MKANFEKFTKRSGAKQHKVDERRESRKQKESRKWEAWK